MSSDVTCVAILKISKHAEYYLLYYDMNHFQIKLHSLPPSMSYGNVYIISNYGISNVFKISSMYKLGTHFFEREF